MRYCEVILIHRYLQYFTTSVIWNYETSLRWSFISNLLLHRRHLTYHHLAGLEEQITKQRTALERGRSLFFVDKSVLSCDNDSKYFIKFTNRENAQPIIASVFFSQSDSRDCSITSFYNRRDYSVSK